MASSDPIKPLLVHIIPGTAASAAWVGQNQQQMIVNCSNVARVGVAEDAAEGDGSTMRGRGVISLDEHVPMLIGIARWNRETKKLVVALLGFGCSPSDGYG